MTAARCNWIKSQVFGKIVDIGCNEGMTFTNSPLASQVTGVDIDKWDPPGYAGFVQADAVSLPFADKEFDCAVVSEILEHVPDPVRVLKEAIRVAKCIVFTVPNEYGWSQNAGPFRTYEDFRKEEDATIAFAKRHPCCIEVVDDRTHPHLFHMRQFTEGSLNDALVSAGLKHRTRKLDCEIMVKGENYHLSFFVGTAIAADAIWDEVVPERPIMTKNLAERFLEVLNCGECLRWDFVNKYMVYDRELASPEFQEIIRYMETVYVRLDMPVLGPDGVVTLELISAEEWKTRNLDNGPKGAIAQDLVRNGGG